MDRLTFLYTVKRYIKYLLAAVFPIGLTHIGAFAIGAQDDRFPVLSVATVICLALELILFLCNLIAAIRFSKKTNRRRVRETNAILNQRAESIRADYAAAQKKLTRMRNIITVYVVFVGLLSLFGLFFAMSSPAPVLMMFASSYIMAQIICGIPVREPIDMTPYLAPAEYPHLHRLAEGARDACGVKGRIRIRLYTGGSVGVARLGGFISLELDPIILTILTEEEFSAILLHEMAHIKNQDEAPMAMSPFSLFLSGDGLPLFVYFLYPFRLYTYETVICRHLASVVVEELADREMAARTDPETAGNALFKTECYTHFSKHLTEEIGELYHAPEACRADTLRRIADTFLLRMHEREPLWREIAEKEIQPRNASHPILRARLSTIGAESVRLVDPEREGAYREESDRALAFYDGELYKHNAENYEKGRAEYYLKPLALIEEWERAGKPCDAETARRVLDALMGLCRNDEALRFATEIIEKGEGLVNHAKFVRGRIRLDRGDDGGIDDLYDAIEENGNYLEEGMDAIGAYCCERGLAERLEEYRERAIVYAQRNIDTDGINSLKPGDTLSEETVLSEEIRARNLAFIRKAGGEILTGVWLVRKRVTEELSSSVYVLRYREDADGALVEESAQQIFEYLDSAPEDWQYSLFYYDKITARALKALPRTQIYDASAE